MTRKDLEQGHYIVFRNGEHGIVFNNSIIFNNTTDENKNNISLLNITDNLTHLGRPDVDIMKVYFFDYVENLFEKNKNTFKGRCVYKREEIKEHTLTELIKKLGYNFKIIE